MPGRRRKKNAKKAKAKAKACATTDNAARPPAVNTEHIDSPWILLEGPSSVSRSCLEQRFQKCIEEIYFPLKGHPGKVLLEYIDEDAAAQLIKESPTVTIARKEFNCVHISSRKAKSLRRQASSGGGHSREEIDASETDDSEPDSPHPQQADRFQGDQMDDNVHCQRSTNACSAVAVEFLLAADSMAVDQYGNLDIPTEDSEVLLENVHIMVWLHVKQTQMKLLMTLCKNYRVTLYRRITDSEQCELLVSPQLSGGRASGLRHKLEDLCCDSNPNISLKTLNITHSHEIVQQLAMREVHIMYESIVVRIIEGNIFFIGPKLLIRSALEDFNALCGHSNKIRRADKGGYERRNDSRTVPDDCSHIGDSSMARDAAKPLDTAHTNTSPMHLHTPVADTPDVDDGRYKTVVNTYTPKTATKGKIRKIEK